MRKLRSIKLEGPVTVAYNKVKDLHMCNALQFDIVGTGASRDEAFSQMRELVEDYLLSIVEELERGRKVRFFNPATVEDWNKFKTLENYDVTFIVDVVRADDIPDQIDLKGMSKLGAYRDSIEAVNLVPA